MPFAMRIFDAAMISSRIHEIGVVGLLGGMLTPYVYILYMDVSVNRGTPKSSILIGFSIINHPFWGTPIFGNNILSFSEYQISVNILILRYCTLTRSRLFIVP